MEQSRIDQILNKMAKERYSTVEKVLEEYKKHQVNGECSHFWPDENTACRLTVEKETQNV